MLAKRQGRGEMEATAAILIGASEFPLHNFSSNHAFSMSKYAFQAYLTGRRPRGLGIPTDWLLDLFDVPDSVPELGEKISTFLERFKAATTTASVRNLIVYYVGHGFFLKNATSEYCLAMASTNEKLERMTALRCADLADLIKSHATSLRKFILVDCCYSGAAMQEFQTSPESIITASVRGAFAGTEANENRKNVPKRGTAIMCACSKDVVARSPNGQTRTMFSDALLHTLTKGHVAYGRQLSLNDVDEIAWEYLQAVHQQPIRPQVHAPDQVDGNVALQVLLFPNANLWSESETESVEGIFVFRAEGGFAHLDVRDGLPARVSAVSGLSRQETEALMKSMKNVRPDDFLSANDLSTTLGTSRQSLAKLVQQHKLFTIHGSFGGSDIIQTLYPAFFADDQIERRDLAKVCVRLASMSGEQKFDFFTSSSDRLSGLAPIEALRLGLVDEVLAAADLFASTPSEYELSAAKTTAQTKATAALRGKTSIPRKRAGR